MSVVSQLVSKVLLAAATDAEASKATIIADAQQAEGPIIDALFTDVEAAIPKTGIFALFGKQIAAAIESEKKAVSEQVANGDAAVFDMLISYVTNFAVSLPGASSSSS